MAWLKSLNKVPSKYDGAYLKLLVERIRTAVNFLDSSNFPNGISGTWLNDGTVSSKKMVSTQWFIPLIALADGKYTASLTDITIGGYISWSTLWGSNVKLRLDGTITSSNAAATCTVTLEGASGVLATLTSSAGTWELKQSALFAAPTAGQTLVLKIKTSNASYNAGLLNAMLILVPNN